MNAPIDQKSTLSNIDIWIVDDDIPVEAAKFEKDDLLTGSRPIDRWVLSSLLALEEEIWTDKAVLEL
jgi:hypothetical protein